MRYQKQEVIFASFEPLSIQALETKVAELERFCEQLTMKKTV
jgi:hypothetical protein